MSLKVTQKLIIEAALSNSHMKFFDKCIVFCDRFVKMPLRIRVAYMSRLLESLTGIVTSIRQKNHTVKRRTLCDHYYLHLKNRSRAVN